MTDPILNELLARSLDGAEAKSPAQVAQAMLDLNAYCSEHADVDVAHLQEQWQEMLDRDRD